MTPTPRTKTGLWIDRVILLAAFLGAGMLLRADTICGIDQASGGNLALVKVACVDYDRLRELSPGAPWPTGKVTQVLVHVRAGDSVRVTVDGVAKFADLSRDAWGRLVALVQFDGVEHAAVAVKVYRAVEE